MPPAASSIMRKRAVSGAGSKPKKLGVMKLSEQAEKAAAGARAPAPSPLLLFPPAALMFFFPEVLTTRVRDTTCVLPSGDAMRYLTP